ncbi:MULTISPECIES: DUF2550 family protein [unclassified Brachybacterium]|uniref:DUF2550 family protein n=1 Tax=unclassified Brachybacterium TaxID=2623841 RepID=UPI000C80293C|nr:MULTISPECIES: DUF2550 family protein [unclassified Brachybacterium]PMC76634.1 DUF2550 domain-containing protein [Brachybacterium sp. UMB0905]
MSASNIPILLLGVGMFVVVTAALVIIRQLVIARGRGAFECTLYRRGLVGEAGWQHGMMRFGTDRLRWHRAFSLRWRPSEVIRRAEIQELTRERLAAGSDGGADMCLVIFQLTRGREQRALVDMTAGAALNAWVEAAPTGQFRGDVD